MQTEYKFEWTDELAMEFAKVAAGGSYGDYKHCKKMSQKLDKFKQIVTKRFSIADIPKTCCVCGEEYTGYGHNAEPLAEGRCCTNCNTEVIMARIERFSHSPFPKFKSNE
jgi:hypothetical protein